MLVYANEIAPVAGAGRAIEQAIKAAPKIDERALAMLRFDDKVKAHGWCQKTYFRFIILENVSCEN